MWRLLAVLGLITGVWAINVLLPAPNGEEQLRAVMGIAAGSASPSRRVDEPPPLAVSKTALRMPQSDALLPEATPLNGSALIASLQEQLRRVGCYKGALDGKWNPATQRAAARFADRIKLRLAADEPPASLLPLIAQFGERACGTPCPAGTQPDHQGSCMTKQVVALAAPATDELPPPEMRETLAADNKEGVPPGPVVDGRGVDWRQSRLAGVSPASKFPLGLGGTASPDQKITRSLVQLEIGPAGGLIAQPAPGGDNASGPLGVAARALGAAAQDPPGQNAVLRVARPTRPMELAEISPATSAATTQSIPAVAQQINLTALKQAAEPATANLTLPKHKHVHRYAVQAASPVALVQNTPLPAPHRRRVFVKTATSLFGFSGGGAGVTSEPLTIVLSKR